MKVSIFNKWFSVWVDYSNREDCIKVIEMTDEEIRKLESWYSYNIETWELEETQESKEYEDKILKDKKTSILKELWELKQIKDWVLLVWEDTTEIDKKIQELKQEINNLKTSNLCFTKPLILN